MNAPFFSIIVPCLNSSNSIHQAVTSIIQQTFIDFEILIIDGNSSDETINILKSFQDRRIRVFSESDGGIYDAMNKGLNLAHGEWLYFLGSDDYLLDKFVFEDIQKLLNGYRGNVLYGNVKVAGKTSWANDGDIYDGEFDFYKFYKKNICHQSIFYNRKFIKKYKIVFNLQYPISADWDFNFQCWQFTKFKYISRTIAVFHAGGISTRSDIVEPFHSERRKYLPLLIRLNERLKLFLSSFLNKIEILLLL